MLFIQYNERHGVIFKACKELQQFRKKGNFFLFDELLLFQKFVIFMNEKFTYKQNKYIVYVKNFKFTSSTFFAHKYEIKYK